jgi:hypothetical protein
MSHSEATDPALCQERRVVHVCHIYLRKGRWSFMLRPVSKQLPHPAMPPISHQTKALAYVRNRNEKEGRLFVRKDGQTT